MSNTLGLHNPMFKRVFKLSNVDKAVEELKTFLRDHISMIILGEFVGSATHIDSADLLCLKRGETQAVLWIKDPGILEKVHPVLKPLVSNFSSTDFGNVLAMTFKMNTEEVVYIIEKNPVDTNRKIAKAEMSTAFAASIALTNNQA